MPDRKRAVVLAVLVLFANACRHGSRATSDLASTSVSYTSPASWLCLPDRVADPCQRDLTATEIRADGSLQIVPPPSSSAAASNPIDCFYVYPTVDHELMPGNHEDFRDERIANVAMIQAARFREVCSVYAPFYRQVTIGTYLRPPDVLEKGLALAYADVEAAFTEYLARHDKGHPLVLFGHSQGAEMIVRLLRRFFDGDGEANRQRRARLLLAMPIGGNVTNGSFTKSLPLCATDDDTSCVLAYRTHLAGSSIRPPRVSVPNVCTNPAGMTAGKHLLARTYFPVTERTRGHLRGASNVTTPFLLLRDYYAAECVEESAPEGYRYLAITPNPSKTDERVDPLDYARDFAGRPSGGRTPGESGLLAPLGLHILDLQFAQGDLIDTITRRARRKLSYAPPAP